MQDEITQQAYLDFHKNLCDNSRELSRLKQNDYCNLTDDLFSVFGNFRNNELFGVCNTDVAILSRFVDKFSRLTNVIKNGNEVFDETEQDTIMDMVNFLILLAYYRHLTKPEEEDIPF